MSQGILDQYGRVCSDRSLEEALEVLLEEKSSVRILDLSDWEIGFLPDVLFAFEQLEELYLDRNGLTSLPDSIGQLQNLRLLSLGRNQITALPQGLLKLAYSLETLFLGHNQISQFPFSEQEFLVLKQGSIGRNPLQGIISRRWMLWDDFLRFPKHIEALIPPTIPRQFERVFTEQAMQIIRDCQEPMVYEIFLEGVQAEKGQIVWTPYFQRSCFQEIGTEMLKNVPRGTILHDSLYPYISFTNS